MTMAVMKPSMMQKPQTEALPFSPFHSVHSASYSSSLGSPFTQFHGRPLASRRLVHAKLPRSSNEVRFLPTLIAHFSIGTTHKALTAAPAPWKGKVVGTETTREIKCQALNSDGDSRSSAYRSWGTLTEQLSASATFAFLPLQLPQIILNYRNLAACNYAALSAVPWTGLLTGLLGNLSLLSYFAGKKERGATIVQAVGVVTTFVVIVQLAMAKAMPGPVFTATTVAVVVGFALNILNYNNLLNAGIWRAWQEVISIGGVSVLPQVMWTTFEPYLPSSLLPGTIFLILATSIVILGRLEKLPKQMSRFMGGVSAWSATFLFMWSPIAQMWTNYINPANIKGLSVLTILLAMLGNSLLLPRALFTRDLMWFTGSSWGALMQGWGILLSMYLNKCVMGAMFFGISCALLLWLGNMLVMDSKAYSLGSPLSPLAELIGGKKGL